MSTRNRRRLGRDKQRKSEKDLIETLSQLEEFERFKRELLPALQKDIFSGMTANQLREKYASYLAGREISIGLGSRDEKAALAAIKNTIDRSEGKAVEKQEITHRLEQLPDKQLESLLSSELATLNNINEESSH